MKKSFLKLIVLLLFISCKEDIPKTTYYKDFETGKIINQKEYIQWKNKLRKNMLSVLDNESKLTIKESFTDSIIKSDSMIKTYKINVIIEPISTKKENIYSYLNKRLPSQFLYTSENKKINLNELKGKPTLLNFWFTTCKPCIDEMPVLNRIKKKYNNKVNFISITFETRENVVKFMKKHKFDFKNIIGAKDYLDKLGVETFPKNVFIDKNGIVKRIENGIPYNSNNKKMEMGNGKEFEKYIKELL